MRLLIWLRLIAAVGVYHLAAGFQFFTTGDDPQPQNFEVEWKRVGKNPARAANVVATVAGEIDST